MIAGLKNKTIVSWGGYDYFRANVGKLKDIEITSVCTGGSPLEIEGYKVIKKEDLLEMDNPFVIISLAKETDVHNAAVWLKNYNIPFTHLSFLFDNPVSDAGIIKAVGGRYTDLNNNNIYINPQATGNILIDVSNSKNGKIIIGKIKVTKQLNVRLTGEDGKVLIGNNTSFSLGTILVNTDEIIDIGKECVFLHHVSIGQPDQYLMFDLNTGARINFPEPIKIGSHVWVEREAKLLGGTEIGNNSIIGAYAVVSGKFPPNAFITGSPAEVIKKDIIWSRVCKKSGEINHICDCEDQRALKYLKKENN